MVIGGKYWGELSGLTSNKSAEAHDRSNGPARWALRDEK